MQGWKKWLKFHSKFKNETQSGQNLKHLLLKLFKCKFLSKCAKNKHFASQRVTTLADSWCMALTHDSCKIEIAQFDQTIFSNQNIFWFHVSVKVILFVEVVESLQRLPSDALGHQTWNTVKTNNYLLCISKIIKNALKLSKTYFFHHVYERLL